MLEQCVSSMIAGAFLEFCLNPLPAQWACFQSSVINLKLKSNLSHQPREGLKLGKTSCSFWYLQAEHTSGNCPPYAFSEAVVQSSVMHTKKELKDPCEGAISDCRCETDGTPHSFCILINGGSFLHSEAPPKTEAHLTIRPQKGKFERA